MNALVLDEWLAIVKTTCALVSYVATACWLYAYVARRNAQRARGSQR